MKTAPVMAFLFAAAGCTSAMSPSDDPAPSNGKADGPGGSGSGSDHQTLRCSSGGNFSEFRATLDASGYDPGSGYFDVRDASFYDNYATAKLLCTGHTLGEIDCIGFWFDVADEVGEVTTTSTAGALTASYHPLRGNLVHMNASPWACTVE